MHKEIGRGHMFGKCPLSEKANEMHLHTGRARKPRHARLFGTLASND
jgi:hypothetical protein